MKSAFTRRFVICGDNHGDNQDDESVRALFQFCEDYRPEVVVHLGDNWDFRAIRNKAEDEERALSMQDDFKSGSEFFNKLFSFGTERYFLRGNHDERLWHLAEKLRGIERDYAERVIEEIKTMCKLRKVKMLPYDARHGVLTIGHLTILHGYHHGVSACATHARIYGNCIFGHIHSIESYQVPGMETKEGRSIGCLCKLDMPYMSNKTAKLRWGNGWAYGLIHPDGTYSIYQTRKIGGKFYAPAEIKQY